jgi:hydrogenase maturation protein HypF
MPPGETAYSIVDYGGAELIEANHPMREGRDVMRRGVLVRGIVQGVGFRPFVYRLATEEELAGSIGNDTDGVSIEVEGPQQKIEAFLSRLNSEMPPLARIDSITARDLPPKGDASFSILPSHVTGQVSTGIPADAATCADCLRELFDSQDRRYRYPFLNCTNCGPRFTITRRIPYDRPQTSMAKFAMCPACQAEYDDPLNRRFHAQPNACWECGPRVWLESANQRMAGRDFVDCEETSRSPGPVTEHDFSRAENAHEKQGALAPEVIEGAHALKGHEFTRAETAAEKVDSEGGGGFNPRIRQMESRPALAAEGRLLSNSLDISSFPAACLAPERYAPIHDAIGHLLAGKIVAIKGIGGFHLSVDATNSAAIERLRQRKHRYGKPLAVMVRDIDAARTLCDLAPEEESLLQTPARPIVLARARKSNGIAAEVAPGIPWLGIFLPYAPLQHLLFADSRIKALVMTSANLSEEPIAIDNDEARTRLAHIADHFLMHDREILQRCDDSVLAFVDGAPQFIRRARGFVPLGIALPFETRPLLAVGGQLKSVFTLARGRFAYQSQHLGDLENLTGLEFFQESLEHLMHTFEIEPECVVHDLHPGYLSTSWAKQWAEQRGLPLIAVQHHHAHIAACMAEHAREGTVIGLSLDGTGYGTDGKIWGGEVLIAQLDTFERFAHLEYVAMPGGESAIREPWRMAFGHLLAAGFGLEEIESLTGATAKEARLIERMIERNVNAPLTSSCGRLFDAVAAVVLQRRIVDYEAQPAIELEGIAIDEPDETPSYTSEFAEDRSSVTGHDFSRAIRGIESTLALAAGGCCWGSSLETMPFSAARSAPEGNQFRVAAMWRELVADLQAGKNPAYIAARLHAAIADAFIDASIRARMATGIGQVALSGGCMHNRRLSRLLRTGLEAEGFDVFQHRQVSPGDGGLSYGQAVIAAAILKNRREQGPSGP